MTWSLILLPTLLAVSFISATHGLETTFTFKLKAGQGQCFYEHIVADTPLECEFQVGLCGCVVVRLCGCVVVWLCGCVVVWLCGCGVVWLCGCVVVWLCGCV